MAELDKVIRSLEICTNEFNVCGRMCEQCQYESDYRRHCHEILMSDALELLKELKEHDLSVPEKYWDKMKQT